MSEYQSSEELHRHSAFVTPSSTEAKDKNVTEIKKVIGVLDKYIDSHSSTVFVRQEAVKNIRTADYQLDLSADLVEMLTKIKKELR